jgi:DNA invertase Pin-like site-specific DNA recombinase
MGLFAIIEAAGRVKRRGRPKGLDDPKERIRREAIVGYWRDTKLTADEVAEAFGVHPQTIRRWSRELHRIGA